MIKQKTPMAAAKTSHLCLFRTVGKHYRDKEIVILHWTIPYESGIDQMTKEQLGEFVLSEFGLDKSEIKVSKDHVEGNPSVLTLRKFITGKRISVYDIKVVNQRNDKVIRIRIRLFKLLLIPMMFPIISWFFYVDVINRH